MSFIDLVILLLKIHWNITFQKHFKKPSCVTWTNPRGSHIPLQVNYQIIYFNLPLWAIQAESFQQNKIKNFNVRFNFYCSLYYTRYAIVLLFLGCTYTVQYVQIDNIVFKRTFLWGRMWRGGGLYHLEIYLVLWQPRQKLMPSFYNLKSFKVVLDIKQHIFCYKE